MTERGTDRRRSFGPTVLLGLAAGVVAAVAGSKPWAVATGTTAARVPELAVSGDAGHMPVAAALALVVLACWGVVLVTRGRVRRLVAGLGVLAAAGLLASVVVGFGSTPDNLAATYATAGYPGIPTERTTWFWLAALAAVLSLAATLVAVRRVGDWPEMGSRYDAPGADPGTGASAAEPGDRSNVDLWKAIDEGRDPTT